MKAVKDGNLYKAAKQVERFYWKRETEEQSWTQPVLSANGTIGGNSFACAASSEYSSNYAWKAFDNNSQTVWVSSYEIQQNNFWLEWYNPDPLRITKIVFTTGINLYNYGGIMYVAKNYKIQASNGNSTWVDIKTGATSSNAVTTITENIDINQAYKYWRIFVLDVWGNSEAVMIDAVAITAVSVEETITPGTAEDYDFYTDENVYKGVNL